MAPISKTLITILLLGSSALAAPLKARQLAGKGAAANSILSGTDNAVGYGTEDALDNTAQLISGQKPAPAGPGSKARRQLAGEGAAADSILSGTDNAVGYGTEDALDNVAQLISGLKPVSAGTGSKSRRQLDKIANGVQAVGNAAGDNLDGTLTSAAADAGAEVADAELDKISNGVQAVGNAAGVGAETEPATTLGDNVDGQATEDAANVGAQVATDEVTVAEQAGGDVPTHV